MECSTIEIFQASIKLLNWVHSMPALVLKIRLSLLFVLRLDTFHLECCENTRGIQNTISMINLILLICVMFGSFGGVA